MRMVMMAMMMLMMVMAMAMVLVALGRLLRPPHVAPRRVTVRGQGVGVPSGPCGPHELALMIYTEKDFRNMFRAFQKGEEYCKTNNIKIDSQT